MARQTIEIIDEDKDKGKNELLKREQKALLKILDILHDFNDRSRFKLVKSAKEFFGIYIGE